VVWERGYDLITMFTGVFAGWDLNVVTKEKIITEPFPPGNREQIGHLGLYGHTMTLPANRTFAAYETILTTRANRTFGAYGACPIFPFTNSHLGLPAK